MLEFARWMFWILLALIAGQALMVCRYVWAQHRREHRGKQLEFCPKATVILCLRGCDPSLDDCVSALLKQDYPDFEVQIVVDSQNDPAWNAVHAIVQRGGAANVHIQPLTDRRTTCSRKIAGLLQVIGGLDPSREMVALLDCDTIPHPTWLRELAAPLADPQVGAASGNRWYMPAVATWGSLARTLWNAAAVVQMYWYGIAWGGSLAVRTEVFRRTDVLDRWANAFGEDSSLCRSLFRQGLKVCFVPSLTMVNRESCSVHGFFHFVQRQLLTVRLHNPWWWAVVAHGILTTLAMTAGLVALVAALAAGPGKAAIWAGGAMAAYLAGCLMLLAALEITARRIVRARGESTAWLTPLGVIKVVLAILLTQAVYAAALVSAIFARTHRWRNVVYRFGGAQPVEVIEDRPYENAVPP